jgi:LPXTG-site transpeptidase (sortase) family protein
MREPMNSAKAAYGLVQASKRAWTRKWSFLAVFLLVLFIIVRIFTLIGFVPDAPVADAADSSTNAGSTVYTPAVLAATTAPTDAGVSAPTNGTLNMTGDLPTKIVIPEVGVNAVVANPDTTNVDALDTYLSYGAARYPTSATLDQQGNVIIFGHSSYLPVVINQHYKTFDGIQNLKAGDQITVYSATTVYTYAVTSEQKESALSDFAIPLTTTGHTLTLATCDSFTTKTDRFIVTATLVGSSPLGSQTS